MSQLEICKIACFFPTGAEYSTRLLAGVSHYLDETPLLEERELPYREMGASPLPEGEWEFSGAIVWSDRFDRWGEELPRRGVKTVQLSVDWRQVDGIVCVAVEPQARCRDAVDHFLDLGCSVVGYVASNLHEREAQTERCETFSRMATQAGMTAVRHNIQGPHPDVNRQRLIDVQHELELLSFLREIEKPAAVWCENDHIARMVCRAAAHIGVAVPKQLAVLGLGDYHVSRVAEPTISTMPNPGETLGYHAAKLLHDWLRSGDVQPDDLYLEPANIIARQSTAVGTSDRDKLITKAQRLISQHACAGLTVEDLAESLDISKRAFELRYAAAFSRTPGEEIRKVKVRYAKKLLVETHLSIGEISAACGFDEQAKFSRFFKRAAGLTPSQFRRRQG
jgi:LacI family transcriptional regulator